MLEMLMDRGSAVDAGNKGGWTALHRAALTGRVPACRLLLRRGAGLNSITKDGRTALHLAALQVVHAWRT
jgi:ankyrin repeat protein